MTTFFDAASFDCYAANAIAVKVLTPSPAPLTVAHSQAVWHSTLPSEWTPELRLWWAVLEESIDRINRMRMPVPLTREYRRLGHEAEEWIRSEDESWPGAFVVICSVFGLDVEATRRAILTPKHRGTYA